MISLETYLWDFSFPLFELKGVNSKKFLNGQTTADILSIQNQSLMRTCWLSPIGRLKAILEIKVIDDNLYFLVLSGKVDELIDGFQKVIFPADNVHIINSGKIRRVQEISIRKSWKETDTEWIFPNQLRPEKFNDLHLADDIIIEEWKIKQGFPSSSLEINGENNPFELGLGDLVNLEKGCYLGQETLSKLANVGRLKHQLRFFSTTQEINPGDALLIESEENPNDVSKAGFITSSMKLSNSLTIGLALIRQKYISFKEIELIDHSQILKLQKPIGFSSPSFD